jgi:GxxExxY protein
MNNFIRENSDNSDNSEKPRNQRAEEELLHHELTRAIIGGFWAVKAELGPGFLEAVYANALAVILREAGLKVEREVPYEIIFHGVRVGWYRADLVVESKVLVETKVMRAIPAEIREIAFNYLAASKLRVGLILNFAGRGEVKRIYGGRAACDADPSG